MKNTDIKKARDKALYDTFKKGLEQGCFATMRQAGAYICRQPAPRFFVEAERASYLVGCILSGSSLDSLNACSRRLAMCLHDRYRQFLADHPGCRLSRERIMEIIVEQAAPEYYIEAQRARKIIYQERRNHLRKWQEYSSSRR